MSDASKDIKKSSRGRPRADTLPIMVRVAREEAEALDGWIAKNGPPFVTRPEAIRRLTQIGLEATKMAEGKD